MNLLVKNLLQACKTQKLCFYYQVRHEQVLAYGMDLANLVQAEQLHLEQI